jgi:16S rRNA (adenine1518-N6/adenine1519-N6)-dimethyltransferase
VLAKAGLRPKKRLGQNFLTDTAIAARIAGFTLEGAPPRARTIEIGAGTGVLTRALVDEGAQLTAMEIDPELVAVLHSRLDIAAAQIVSADALTFDTAAGRRESGGAWRATFLITSQRRCCSA